jgi:hypothetical protein
MSAARHVWGVSAARDRVWSHVNGLGNEKARKRLLAVWQAFVDESFDDKFYVIGGFIETADTWANFSDEWQQMLPFSSRGRDGTFEFKMAEMAQNSERMQRAQAFYRIIERWLTFWFVFVMRPRDLANARSRIIITHQDGRNVIANLGFFNNEYMVAWNMFMRGCFRHRDVFASNDHGLPPIPMDQKIDFIFDERLHEKKEIIAGWDDWKRRLPENGHLAGTAPRFEDSAEFMPLQAADFMCWWIRERMHQPRHNWVEAPELPWPSTKPIGYYWNYMDEDDLTGFMTRIVRTAFKEWGHPVTVYDAKGVHPPLRTYG